MAKVNIQRTLKAVTRNMADVNNDGVVDEKDLSIVHKEYQKAKKKAAAKKPVAKKAAAKPAAKKRGRPSKKK
jgi:hypothetical protein